MGRTIFSALGLKRTGSKPDVLFDAVVNGSSVFDPASLTTATGVTSSAIAVAGAVLGDFVIVSAPYDQAGVIANGYVTAADTVKITLFNASGATVDLASGTWKIKVLRG